ncbi:MAG: hypothetical protein ACRC1Z_26050 [Waterburya sp.]
MLTEEELEQHCQIILKDSRISNRIVVLCEGIHAENGERLSPELYRSMDKLPDSNFYRACIPSTWTQNVPRFFNCGDRHDTLSSYFKLLEIHDREPSNSFLSPDLLFALVDIDLNTATITNENYGFADTELIFHDLYQDLKIIPENLSQHRIWVTGLMHKEAYFLNPDLQSIFDEYELPIDYREQQIDLNLIYQDMVQDLPGNDLEKHFTKAIKRIYHCDNLDFTNVKTLAKSWQKLLTEKDSIDPKLIFALLAIVKSKSYWKQVMNSSSQRESLSLQIARRFYAQQDSDQCTSYHLPCFFKYLYDFWHSRLI